MKFKSIGESILEDINGDGKVDLIDLSLVAGKYNLKSTEEGYSKDCALSSDV